MTVIVNNEQGIELSLRWLWRESTRENIIKTLQARRYYVPKSFDEHQKRRLIRKGKRRRRTAARRNNI